MTILQRLVLIVRAHLSWWRGIRVPMCPSCGDVNTDDLLPDNPEPAYCLGCATTRKVQRDAAAAEVERRDRVKYAANPRAALVDTGYLRSSAPGGVFVEQVATVARARGPVAHVLYELGQADPVAHYDAQGRLLMSRDPVNRTITINGRVYNEDSLVNAANADDTLRDWLYDHNRPRRD